MRRIVETSAVITALDEALVKVARFRRTFAPLEPFKELRWVAIQEAMELSKISRGIHKILEAEPIFSGNLMMNFGSDSVSITAFIGQKLLEVAETRGSEPALEWLDKVLNTSAASCLCVAVVRGVKVEGSIDFGQGIVLMPFDNLPPSNNKRALTRDGAPFDLTRDGAPFEKTPESALLCNTTIHPFISIAGEEFIDQIAEVRRRLHSAALVLTAIGPSAPTVVSFWVHLLDDDLRQAKPGEGRSFQYLEVLPMPFQMQAQQITGKAIKTVRNYLELDERCTTKLEPALKRLNQALRRHATADKVLDTAIALEALLAEDESGEIGFRLALRASLFLKVRWLNDRPIESW